LNTKRPIFRIGRPNERIGYIDGGNAYDLAGRLRCNYSEASGNLFSTLDTGKIIGHVSLEGYFVGPSWIADELFRASAEEPVPLLTSPEASTGEQSGEPETEPSGSVDADVERALENLRMVLGTK
jgi:hypothetical protein